MTLADWPALNAALNAASALLLLGGYVSIRARRVSLHRACMLLACGVSALFLISYVLYHARVGATRFTRTGWVRPAYVTILLTHTVLAVAIVPLVARTLWWAARGEFKRHAALSRRLLPLWLYVSVTGVVIYWLLYRSP